MGELFGTDGIRGLANQGPIIPEMGMKLGRAVIQFLRRRGKNPTVLIGRDTRLSGEMLEYAVLSGVLSAGGNVYRTGVLPTPGVSYLTRELGAGAGIVISASHNSYEYNGFKVFSHEGYKLSDAEESEIESLLIPSKGSSFVFDRPVEPGWAQTLDDAVERYISFLKSIPRGKHSLDNMKIVIDCANGATSKVAPPLFERLGIKTDVMFADPDGKNINQNCGSQQTDALREKVLESGADAGLSFDGDGDRLIAVDEKGQVVTGDQILTICARLLKEEGELSNNLVVSTVMSNIGFALALKSLGVEHISTQVGDRHVMEEMKARNASLGGEDSGHIIFLNHHTTGDGLLSALQVLLAIKSFEQPLSKLAALMIRFPQTIINIPIKRKPKLSHVPELVKVIKTVERMLGEGGRVLVRYSGTEPVCRVMVEGEKEKDIEEYALRIGAIVRRNLSD